MQLHSKNQYQTSPDNVDLGPVHIKIVQHDREPVVIYAESVVEIAPTVKHDREPLVIYSTLKVSLR